MADDLVLIRLRLTGAGEVEAEAERASAAVKGVGAAAAEASATSAKATGGIAKSLKQHGAAMAAFGGTLTRYVSAPLLAVGGASAYLSANFQRQMSLISTQAGGSAREVSHLEKSVLGLAHAGSKFTPDEMAKSLFFIESAGKRGPEAMKALRASIDEATIGNSNLEHTTFGLMGVINALGKEGHNFTKIIGEMNSAVGHGHMRMEELVSALGTGLVGAGKQFGLSFGSMTSSLAFFTRMGEPAQQAATRMRMTITHLATDATEKGTKALERIGLSGIALGKIIERTGRLGPAIKVLAEHLDTLNRAERKQVITEAFGGGRFGTQVMEATGRYGLLLKTEQEAAEKATAKETMREKHEAEEQSLVKLDKAWSSVNASLIELGSVILPVAVPLLEQMATVIGGLASGFSSLPKPMQSVVLALSAGLAIGGPFLIFLGRVTQAMGILAETRLGGWAASLVSTVVGLPSTLASGFASVRAYFIAQGTLMGTVFDTAVAVGVAAGAALLAYELYQHLSSKTKEAMHRWGVNAAQNFVNALIDGVNWGIQQLNGVLNEINALSFLGVHAPQIGEIGHVNFHGSLKQQEERAEQAHKHGLISGPHGSFVSPKSGAQLQHEWEHRQHHQHERHRRQRGGWGGGWWSHRGLAAGAESWGGGLAMVGEQGPELLYLPPGVDVMPNGPTRRWQEDNPTAPGRLGDHRPRMQRRLLPIVLKLDSKTIAETVVQVHDDAEARR